MTMRIGAALVVALLALVACDDDGASVRDLGGSASSGSGSGSGSGTVASGSGSEPAAECAEPEPGEPALAVTLDEYQITPDEDELTRGPQRFLARNAGEETHELVVVAARSVEALPLDAQGGVDEEALEEEDRIVAEVEAVAPGGACKLEVDLDPGTYVLFCNIRERGDDGVVNHFLQGMRARIKVS
ncbi:MAG TPA: hypothetical protein VEU29_06865 [Actinomycetota bacterium]|nr:hypothetical protein [Actinomycetota bacterium]